MRTQSARGRGVSVGGVLLQLLPWALLFLLFAAVGILHVASRVLVVDAGYQLSRLEHEGQKLALENGKLKIELTLLKSPARLEKVAREKLAMAPVPAGAVVAVGPSSEGPTGPAQKRRAREPADRATRPSSLLANPSSTEEASLTVADRSPRG
jgi:cell division protein FtsL